MFEKSKQSLKQKQNSNQNSEIQKQKNSPNNQTLKKQMTQKRCSQRRKNTEKLNALAMDSDDSDNSYIGYRMQNIKRLSEKQYLKMDDDMF